MLDGRVGIDGPALHPKWMLTVRAHAADRHSELGGLRAVLLRPDGYADFAWARGAD